LICDDFPFHKSTIEIWDWDFQSFLTPKFTIRPRMFRFAMIFQRDIHDENASV
jgi:hypothetical protein